MIINVHAKLAYLAMTKCGSTAFENAIKHEANISYTGIPRFTHMIAQQYHLHMKPYLKYVGQDGIETTSVIRYPISWLESWWRYRTDPVNTPEGKRTDNISFDHFANDYADRSEVFHEIWGQANFLCDDNLNIMVDHVFRYEEYDQLQKFWEERLGYRLKVERYNISQERVSYIAPTTINRLENEFPRDFEIWESGTIGHLNS